MGIFHAFVYNRSMQIREHVQLDTYTTFGFPNTARYFVTVRTVDELQEVLKSDIYHNYPSLCLGGGSNVLFTEDYDGIVIHNDIHGIEITHHDDTYIEIRVGAGENWHELVMYTVAEGWGGFENLALIPGTVGGTPVQNIGAYGVEISEHIVEVEVLDTHTGEIKKLKRDECAFGYRASIFKTTAQGRYIITHVHFRLNTGNHIVRTDYGDIQNILEQKGVTNPHIDDVCQAVIAIRSAKLPDPKFIGNAGSFFKNPIVDESVVSAIVSEYPQMPYYTLPNGRIKIPAGWLIDTAGWKGYRRGSVGVHDKQALVLVHFEGGSSTDLVALARDIMDDVFKKFSITLEPEVTFISNTQ